MYQELLPSMLLTAAQSWVLRTPSSRCRHLMALVNHAATVTRGGNSGTSSLGSLPGLLPDLPPSSQFRLTQLDSPSLLTPPPPALSLPRPAHFRSTAPAAQSSPRLPALIPTTREDTTATATFHAALPGKLSPSPIRTPALPLLPSLAPDGQASCLPSPTSLLPTVSHYSSSTSASAAAADAVSIATTNLVLNAPTPLPRTGPTPPPLLRRISTRLPGLLLPATYTLAPRSPRPTTTRSALAPPTSPPYYTTTITHSHIATSSISSSATNTESTNTPSSSTDSTYRGDALGTAAAAASIGTTTASDSAARGASVDPREAAKFAALAASWWRTADGPFAPLHALNPARVRFVRQSLASLIGLDAEAPEPLTGLRVLDVGCGGGILSESLARLGAEVHGIDVTRENVEAARVHARTDPRVAARVRYDVISAEDLALSNTALYDVVIASEVLEHVSRPHQLLPVLASLMTTSSSPSSASQRRDGEGEGDKGEGEAAAHQAVGALIVSTLNRTPASWAVAIAGAEYLTGVVPLGTHQWQRFISPEELSIMADSCGLQVWHAAGMCPSGPRLSWQLTPDLAVNYIATLRRKIQDQQHQEQQ